MKNTSRTVGTLDELLLQICVSIQLTQAQFRTATKRYRNVGEWLEGDNTVAKLQPHIFPQGSMLIRTTNRPMSKEGEDIPFDLDLVCRCIVDPHVTHARDLYNVIKKRLEENADYKKRLKSKNRCIALDYSSDAFKLDVIPACIDPSDPHQVAILIPDRGLWKTGIAPIESWKRTDPLRIAAWFEVNCEVGHRNIERQLTARVEPVPPAEPAHEKAPLRNIVQLIKRYRDITFLGDESIPTSIMFTTLAARKYRGDESLSVALDSILAGIEAQIEAAHPGRIHVPNPTDHAEDFAAPMSNSAYMKFCKMISNMREHLSEASTVRGIPELKPILGALFGGHAVGRALAAAEKEVKSAHDDGRLGTGNEGLAILSTPKVKAGVQPMRPSNFHESD